MENSKAYSYFIEQLNAVGTKRMDGYYPKLMEEIYDWERDEIEDIVWKQFCEKEDIDVAAFLPKLKKYQGVEKLKEMLLTSTVPSERSVTLSIILYEINEDKTYLEIIKKNIELEPNKISNVSKLIYCKPNCKIYELLVEIYINSESDIIRSTAVTGILYNKGIITNPLDLQEIIKNIDLERKFDSDDLTERKKIIEKFEKHQL